MSDESVELICKGCSQTFQTFLEKMAEHNGKLTCPNCGQTHGYEPHNAPQHE